MSSMSFFLTSLLVFMALSGLVFLQLQKSFSRRYEELQGRFAAQERALHEAQADLDLARVRSDKLAAEVEHLTQAVRKRDAFMRSLLPEPVLTPLTVIRIKRMASEQDIAEAKQYLLATGDLLDIEDALARSGRLSDSQLEEARKLAERYKNLPAMNSTE